MNISTGWLRKSRNMSRIDEMLREMCPEGVEYVELGKLEDDGLITLGRGKVISKKDKKFICMARCTVRAD